MVGGRIGFLLTTQRLSPEDLRLEPSSLIRQKRCPRRRRIDIVAGGGAELVSKTGQAECAVGELELKLQGGIADDPRVVVGAGAHVCVALQGFIGKARTDYSRKR